jgi:hypothetical protein
MPAIAPVLLSNSTNGRQIKVVATASPGTDLHTATATDDAYDEVWIYATNSDPVSRDLTVQWGGTTSPDDSITLTLPAKSGPVCIIPGIRLRGGVVVKAFAAAANVVLIAGNVNRYTP